MYNVYNDINVYDRYRRGLRIEKDLNSVRLIKLSLRADIIFMLCQTIIRTQAKETRSEQSAKHLDVTRYCKNQLELFNFNFEIGFREAGMCATDYFPMEKSLNDPVEAKRGFNLSIKSFNEQSRGGLRHPRL